MDMSGAEWKVGDWFTIDPAVISPADPTDPVTVSKAYCVVSVDGKARASGPGVFYRDDLGCSARILTRYIHRCDPPSACRAALSQEGVQPDPQPAPTELQCHRCGGRNVPSWSVQSDIWNATVRGIGGESDPMPTYEGSEIICPACFTDACEVVGLEGNWELVYRGKTTPEFYRRMADHLEARNAREAASLSQEGVQPRCDPPSDPQPAGWFADWSRRVDQWHEAAFPDESMEQLGLCLGEEGAELVEALAEGSSLTVAIGKVTRTILKETHGANDRRASTDWKAERAKEFGDVMICLAKIAARDGFDPQQVCEERLAYVAERFPGAALSQEGAW